MAIIVAISRLTVSKFFERNQVEIAFRNKLIPLLQLTALAHADVWLEIDWHLSKLANNDWCVT